VDCIAIILAIHLYISVLMLIWELECLFALLDKGAFPIKIGFIGIQIILLD